VGASERVAFVTKMPRPRQTRACPRPGCGELVQCKHEMLIPGNLHDLDLYYPWGKTGKYFLEYVHNSLSSVSMGQAHVPEVLHTRSYRYILSRNNYSQLSL
jgi:hypothetical protein